MIVSLRPAHDADFDYCARLYFAGMEETIRRLGLDRTAQERMLRQRWAAAEVRIIRVADADAGWMQARVEADSVFLAQLFVEAPRQRQGIGTKVVQALIGEAARDGHAVTLGVVRGNPAQRLYERLGFRVTHSDDRKHYMRRNAGR